MWSRSSSFRNEFASANPLASISADEVELDNSGQLCVDEEYLNVLMSLMKKAKDETARLALLEARKDMVLFDSQSLIRLLDRQFSKHIRYEILQILIPRISDPSACVSQILDRIDDDSQKLAIQDLLLARAQELASTASTRRRSTVGGSRLSDSRRTSMSTPTKRNSTTGGRGGRGRGHERNNSGSNLSNREHGNSSDSDFQSLGSNTEDRGSSRLSERKAAESGRNKPLEEERPANIDSTSGIRAAMSGSIDSAAIVGPVVANSSSREGSSDKKLDSSMENSINKLQAKLKSMRLNSRSETDGSQIPSGSDSLDQSIRGVASISNDREVTPPMAERELPSKPDSTKCRSPLHIMVRDEVDQGATVPDASDGVPKVPSGSPTLRNKVDKSKSDDSASKSQPVARSGSGSFATRYVDNLTNQKSSTSAASKVMEWTISPSAAPASASTQSTFIFIESPRSAGKEVSDHEISYSNLYDNTENFIDESPFIVHKDFNALESHPEYCLATPYSSSVDEYDDADEQEPPVENSFNRAIELENVEDGAAVGATAAITESPIEAATPLTRPSAMDRSFRSEDSYDQGGKCLDYDFIRMPHAASETLLDVTNMQLSDSLYWSELDSTVLPNVSVLLARYNKIQELRSLQLSSTPFRRLQQLDLAYNRITGIPDEKLLPTNLLNLDLSHNRISDITGILSCPNLLELNLSFNKIKDFVMLPNKLVRLSMSNNRILGSSTLRKIAICTKLDSLDIDENPVIKAVPRWKVLLKSIMPGLNILNGEPVLNKAKLSSSPSASIADSSQLSVAGRHASSIEAQRPKLSPKSASSAAMSRSSQRKSDERLSTGKLECQRSRSDYLQHPSISRSHSGSQGTPSKSSKKRESLTSRSPPNNMVSITPSPSKQTTRHKGGSTSARASNGNSAPLSSSSRSSRSAGLPSLERASISAIRRWLTQSELELMKAASILSAILDTSALTKDTAKHYCLQFKCIDFYKSRVLPLLVEKNLTTVPSNDPILLEVAAMLKDKEQIRLIFHQLENAFTLCNDFQVDYAKSISALMNTPSGQHVTARFLQR